MAILPTPVVDFSDYDFDSVRARLYNLISVAFPDWTDQSVASFGNLLIELMSHVGDVLGFYLDARARESRLTLATQRQSVIALAKLLGYVPEGASSAQVEATLRVAAPLANDVSVPAGTVIRTPQALNAIEFQTLTAVSLLSGETSVSLSLEHSKSFFELFPATGLANQELRLSNAPFLDGSEVVQTAAGQYTRVESFLLSSSSDRHYTVVVDQGDRARLRFGNGTNGVIPSGLVGVEYKTGGGAEGNVEPNTLRKVESVLTDVLGNPVACTVTNPFAASGGQARRSRAQMQVEAPQRLRVLTRTVAREDYEINARRVPGVARALMLTSNQVPAIRENTGQLYIVPAGGGKPAQSMLDAVLTMVTDTYPNTITFDVKVIGAVYLVVNVQVTVFLRMGTSPKAVDAAIRKAYADLFALTINVGTEDEADNPNVNWGFYASQTSEGGFDGVLALSDIANAARDVSGVRRLGDGINDLLVNGAHSDVVVLAHQFPKLGSVVILNGETNAPLV